MLKINKVFDYIEKFLMSISVLALVVLVLLTAYDVVTRKITGQSVPGLADFVQDFLMVILAYLGTGYVFSRDGHVRMTLVISRLPEKLAAIFNRITDFISVITFVVIDIVSIGIVSKNLKNHITSPGIWGYEMWPCYLILTIGLIALTLRLVQSLIFPKSVQMLHDSEEEKAEHQ